MGVEYKYKDKIINVDNYQKIIPLKILWIIIRTIIYIFFIIYGTTLFKIFGTIFLVYDILSFIALFLIYYVIYNGSINQPTSVKSNKDIKDFAKMMNVDLDKDDLITIKKKYRDLSKKYHPDKYINETTSKQDIANRNFQRLNTAYNAIIDYKKNKK